MPLVTIRLRRFVVGIVCMFLTAAFVLAHEWAIARELALLDSGETSHREFTVEPKVEKQGPIVLVIEQELQEFLELAGKLNGVDVTFSSEISGTLKDKTFPMELQKLLPVLGDAFDLKWHIHSRRLFVSHGSLQSRRVLHLDGVALEDLKVAVAKTGFRPTSPEMTGLDDVDAVLVSGPPSYLDAVFVIAQELKGIGTPDE